ncbi:MAG: ATP-binding protein [Lachnospiraceae bacterium]|nr:ATP-binding protein [Lachnospiraceae bacterium]
MSLRKKDRRGGDIISGMFLSAALAMILTMIMSVAAQLIDGIVTSRVMGGAAYSGIALLGPFFSVIYMLQALLSLGNQIVCSAYIGEGKKEEAGSVLSFFILAGLATAAVILLACAAMPDTLLAICGVKVDRHPEMYGHMIAYLRGYMPGIPAMILIQIISPMIVLDSGKYLLTASAAVLCVTDIIGDLLNAFVFHGGTFGMGLATSIAYLIQLLLLISHFLRKEGYFRFSLKKLRWRDIFEGLSAGSPALVQRFATTLRDLLINRINLNLAMGGAAVFARGLQSDLSMLFFCVGLGIGKTMATMSGVYYSAEDRQGLRRLFAACMRLALRISLLSGTIVFLAAPKIASLYTADPASASLGAFSIRCMAVGLTADVLACAFLDYLQGTRRRAMVNVFSTIDRFFIPVTMASVLGLSYGSKGVLAAVAAGKFILVTLLFMRIWQKNGHFPVKWDDFLLLPEDFGGGDAHNYYASISEMEDAVRVSEEIDRFCTEHGADRRTALRMALFAEEMGGNIIRHGRPRGGRTVSADIRLFVNKDKISLALRDYCQAFDPTIWYEANQDGDPGKESGIRMVMALADEKYYYNAFNSNNLVITMRSRSGSRP